MTASLSPYAGRIEFPNLEISNAITPLLAVEEQINLAEEDWLVRADRLPQNAQRGQRRLEIRAFVGQLRADVNDMLRFKKDIAQIATVVNQRVEKFEASWGALQTHNAEYERDKRSVHEGNNALSQSLRQMHVDFAPFAKNQQKREKELPRHQTAKAVFEQIAKVEQGWLKKADSYEKEKKDCYHQQVRFHVLRLEEEAKKGLNLNLSLAQIQKPIENLQKVFDKSLEVGYQSNTLQKAYAQITKIEKEMLKRAEHLPPKEQAAQRAHVDRFIGDLNQEVVNLLLLNPDAIEKQMQTVVEAHETSSGKKVQPSPTVAPLQEVDFPW